MRERIYFVGVRKDIVPDDFTFFFPLKKPQPHVSECLVGDKELSPFEKKLSFETFVKYLNNPYNKGSHSIQNLLSKEFSVIDTRQSDLRIYTNRVPTLRTGRHGILYVKDGKFRKLSGYESLLLQGFPKNLAEKVDGVIQEIHLLKQTGNAMTVTTIEAIAKELFKTLEKYENQ
jgi:DNA (cytosine-5)-methyltransferase 1